MIKLKGSNLAKIKDLALTIVRPLLASVLFKGACFASENFAYTDSAGLVARLSTHSDGRIAEMISRLEEASESKENLAKASRIHRDVRSCLTQKERLKVNPDLTQFEWPDFHGSFWSGKRSANLVCILRVSDSYSDPYQFFNWLKAQGHRVSSINTFFLPDNETVGIRITSLFLTDSAGKFVPFGDQYGGPSLSYLRDNRDEFQRFALSITYTPNGDGEHWPSRISLWEKFK